MCFRKSFFKGRVSSPLENHFQIRLCLFHVSDFPENTYFLEMLFFGKENIFKCLVAFQKMLWKIFSGVWLSS